MYQKMNGIQIVNTATYNIHRIIDHQLGPDIYIHIVAGMTCFWDTYPAPQPVHSVTV